MKEYPCVPIKKLITNSAYGPKKQTVCFTHYSVGKKIFWLSANKNMTARDGNEDRENKKEKK